MYSVWKFNLPVDTEPMIEMPLGAKPLSVQVQRGVPCVWALVDPEEKRRENHWFVLCGTGAGLMGDPEEMTFLGTFQLDAGALVFHLWDNGRTLPVPTGSNGESDGR